MKITFIKPGIGSKGSKQFKEKTVMEPLVFAILAGLTPDDVEIAFFDDRIEDVPYDDQTDMVAVTADTFTARRAYEICQEYRKRKVPTILGGIHATLATTEAAHFADCIYVGDGEELWPTVLNDLKRGELKPIYRASSGNLQSNMKLKRDIFTQKNYLTIAPVQFTRGCTYRCNFCTVHQVYDRKHYHRQIDEVIEEVAGLGNRLVLFVDDNICLNKRVARELFRELTPLKIRWASEGDINMAADREMMELMTSSGCIAQLVGFESLETRNLLQMDKMVNIKGRISQESAVEIFNEFGLLIWATFTFGYDYDSPDTIQRTLDYSIQKKFTLTDFNVLNPYPGSEIYRQLQQENRLLYNDRWWLHNDYRYGDVVFKPNSLSPEELGRYCQQARETFFSTRSLFKRFLDFNSNCSSLYSMYIYFLMNILGRHDIMTKKDLRLGSTDFLPENSLQLDSSL